MGWGILLALGISLVLVYMLFGMIRKVVPLLLNGILGVAVFWALAYFNLLRIPIDIFTFAVAAIGGIFGIAIILVLAFFGVPL